MKRLNYEFLFVLHIVKDLLFENEETAIDAYAPVIDRVNIRNKASISLFERNQMITKVRSNAKKARDFSLLVKVIELLRKRKVGKSIAVVRKKLLFALEVLLHSL